MQQEYFINILAHIVQMLLGFWSSEGTKIQLSWEIKVKIMSWFNQQYPANAYSVCFL